MRFATVFVFVAVTAGAAAAGETWPEHRVTSASDQRRLIAELRQTATAHPLIRAIEDILIHQAMPVDIRHNAKIFRERLAEWAARRRRDRGSEGRRDGEKE